MRQVSDDVIVEDGREKRGAEELNHRDVRLPERGDPTVDQGPHALEKSGGQAPTQLRVRPGPWTRTDGPHAFQAPPLLFDNSLLLVAGTIAAVVWANLDLASYDRITHPLHFWVNDVGMVFFFALAAKEVFEATLPGGPLASPRQALAPLAAAVGGMVAPAVIYLALTSTVGPAELSRGWAIPCATDIAFSAMIARVIFPSGHPAIPFLLLLAIADDALGLMILAVFYPSGPLSVVALAMLMTAAVLAALWLKRRRVRSFWPYVHRSRIALMGGAVLRWFPSGLGAGPHRALHAAQSA